MEVEEQVDVERSLQDVQQIDFWGAEDLGPRLTAFVDRIGRVREVEMDGDCHGFHVWERVERERMVC